MKDWVIDDEEPAASELGGSWRHAGGSIPKAVMCARQRNIKEFKDKKRNSVIEAVNW